MSSDPARLRAIAAQHAETARLLGVDFVPMYRTRSAATSALASPAVADAAAPRQAPATQTPATQTPATQTSTPIPAEVFPARATDKNNDATLLVEPKATPPAAASRASSARSTDTGTRDRAVAQSELDEIRARYEREAPHKAFVTSFKNIVFGEGDPCARLMFIGEAPGEEEDKTGRPFVGRAGKLLNDMIVAMGLTREDVYIANVLKTRPPNNATPTGEECKASKPYLFEQVAAIRPEVIVTLGLPATRTVLDSVEAMGKLRGKWASFRDPRGRDVPVMPTYHPAYLLRNYTPEERRKVWSDLRLVMDRLGLPNPRS